MYFKCWFSRIIRNNRFSSIGQVYVGITGLTGYNGITGSTAADWIDNLTTSITTTNTTTKYLIIVSLQAFAQSNDTHFAFTIGRGSTCTLSTNYINLANNIAFTTTEIAMANTTSSENNLLTSLQCFTINPANTSEGINIQFIDRPSVAGTYYYGIRYIQSKATQCHFRVINFYTIQLSS